MRSLALALITHKKIETSEAKAKELRPYIEKLLTKAKSKTLASRRLLVARLGVASAAARLIRDIAPLYEKRSGGYTRIIKTPVRRSDGSRRAIIEFV